MLPAVADERVLDIACGQGRMSRYLSQRGANVVGVDISAAMLGKARAAGPEDITYVRADVTRHPAWWDGQPFDGCTCELALMDIDDLAGTLSTVTTVVRPGGWFAASIVHPCHPGGEKGRSSWPPEEGYEREGWWTSPDHNPDGVRIRVGRRTASCPRFSMPCLPPGWKPNVSSSRRPRFRRTCYGGAAAANRCTRHPLATRTDARSAGTARADGRLVRAGRVRAEGVAGCG